MDTKKLELTDFVDRLYEYGVSRRNLNALKIGKRWDSKRQVCLPTKPILRVQDLVQESADTLVNEVTNIGLKAVWQIQEALAQAGYCLKGEEQTSDRSTLVVDVTPERRFETLALWERFWQTGYGAWDDERKAQQEEQYVKDREAMKAGDGDLFAIQVPVTIYLNRSAFLDHVSGVMSHVSNSCFHAEPEIMRAIAHAVAKEQEELVADSARFRELRVTIEGMVEDLKTEKGGRYMGTRKSHTYDRARGALLVEEMRQLAKKYGADESTHSTIEYLERLLDQEFRF